MALVNAVKIEEYTGIRRKAAEKIAVYIPDAVRELKRVLSAGVYNDIAELDEEQEDRQALERAEAFLAVYFSLPMLNMRIADAGGLLKMVGHGDYQEELMSQRNLEAVRAAIRDFALDIIDHLLPDTNDEGMFTGRGFGLTAVPASERRDFDYRRNL